MKKHILLVQAFLFVFLTSSSQQADKDFIDSLKKRIIMVSGAEKVNCLNLIARAASTADHINRKQRPDSVFYYASEAFKEAKKIDYKKGMALALTNQAFAEWLSGMNLRAGKQDDAETLQKVEDYLSKAIPLAEEIKDHNILGYAYENWSDLEFIKNKNAEIRAKYVKMAIDHFRLAGNHHKEGENSLFQAERYISDGYYDQD